MSKVHNSYAPFITVYRAAYGYKWVHMWWNVEEGGFWEPWSTGDIQYPTQAEAIPEAKLIADGEGIRYIEPEQSNG